MFKPHYQLICLIQLLVLLILVLGCSHTRVGHPVWGVTRRFPVPAVGREAKASPYDFTRLEEGRGLFIFSYSITFKGPNRQKAKTSTGLRVWEHDFKVRTLGWKEDLRSDNVDTITKLGLIPVGRRYKGMVEELLEENDNEDSGLDRYLISQGFSDLPSVITIADGFISVFSGHGGAIFEMRYQRGRIVYGGHVYVNGVGARLNLKVTDCYVDDIGPILKRFAEELDGVEIITDLMTLPPPPPIDSTRIIDTIRPEPRREVEFDDL